MSLFKKSYGSFPDILTYTTVLILPLLQDSGEGF